MCQGPAIAELAMVLNLRKGPSGPPAVISDTIVEPGELLGNPLTATTTEPAVPLDGAEVGAIVRYANVLNMDLAPGTHHNLEIPDGIQILRLDPNPTGTAFITGLKFLGRGNAGAYLSLSKFNNGGSIVLLPQDAGSDPGNRFSTPGEVPYELPSPNDTVNIQAFEEPGQPIVFQVCDRLVPPTGVTQELAGFGVTITIAVEFPAGAGGAPDDVTILAVVPFQVRILDATLDISTAVVGSTATVRNQAGGGGAALTSALSTAATGTVRNNDTATRTTSLSLFLRRSDSGVAGTIILTLNRV